MCFGQDRHLMIAALNQYRPFHQGWRVIATPEGFWIAYSVINSDKAFVLQDHTDATKHVADLINYCREEGSH